MFSGLADAPVLGFLAGTGVAFLIQSSSATIGILQALSMTGVLTFGSVYAIIIGVNIGDCVTTAIVCSIGSKADAKRTGVVHIIFNLCASVIIITALTVLHHAGARRPVGADDDLRRHRERPHDLPPFHRGSAPAGVRAV